MEATVAAPAAAPPGAAPVIPPPEAPKPYAGKYADESAFRNGLNEARKMSGLDPLSEKVKLIGEDGVFATRESAEKEYGKYVSFGSKGKAPEAAPTTQPLVIGGELTDSDGPDQILSRAGLDKKDIAEQFTKEGKLTDDQYAKIRKVNPGYGRAIADKIVAGEIALAKIQQMELNAVLSDAAAPFGGIEQFKTFLKEVAPQFLSTEQAAYFTQQLNNSKTAAMAAKTLKVMHAEHVGTAGTKPIASGAPGAKLPTPTTAAELDNLMKKAMAGDNTAMAILMQTNSSDIKIPGQL